MNKILHSLFISFISIIISSDSVLAITEEFSINTDKPQKITSRAKEATLYNFSNDLLSAAETCQSYSENFTDFNPDLKELGALFGNTDFEILVDIKGISEDTCKFDVTQKIMSTRIINHCEVNENERKEIIAAMHDRSKELITETFTTYMTLKDEDGNIINRSPIDNTMTDTRFNIVFSKIMGNNCQEETEEPSEQEIEEIKNSFMSLSEPFIQSLHECKPDKETKEMMFFPITVEIIGKEDNLCLVKYDDFDLHLSEEKITEITNLDDINKLLTDKNIATYNKKDIFNTSNLLDIIDNCQNKTSGSSETTGTIKIEKRQQVDYQNNLCTISLENTIIRNDTDIEKYRITCKLSDEYREKIKEKYEDLISRKMQLWKMESLTSNNTEKFLQLEKEKEKADKEIFNTLKKDGQCQ